MRKRVMAILLMSALVLSFACGCKNTDTESTSSTVSKTESSVSSSKGSNVEISKSSESSIESNYDKMMYELDQLTSPTVDDVFGIIDTYATFEGSTSGILMCWYTMDDDYHLTAAQVSGGVELSISNKKTNESQLLFYRAEYLIPYDENVDYDDVTNEIAEKLSSLTTKSTRDDIIKVLGDPTETYGEAYIKLDKWKYKDHEIYANYYDECLVLYISEDTKTQNSVYIIYPE